MIEVRFLRSESEQLVGYLMTGHSDFGERGSDIVCASVSSAAYMTANTITDVMNLNADINVSEIEEEDHAAFLLRMTESEAFKCRDLLAGLELHIKALAEDYPDYIRVNYLEVQDNA